MGGFVLFWHKGLGFCPEGFCPRGFCPRGFCPRGVLSYTHAKQTSLFVIVTQHSNSHVHEDLKFKFFIVKVIRVVNMTS